MGDSNVLSAYVCFSFNKRQLWYAEFVFLYDYYLLLLKLYSHFINKLTNSQYYYQETLFLLIISEFREMPERLSVNKFRASENALSEAALVAGMQTKFATVFI